ncbi:immunoglobulin superfamily member 11 isoform X2 [Protopterus annectens]|nr:immunoglobulin superfamily member 11 isoform X2 [Protopterus annectens]
MVSPSMQVARGQTAMLRCVFNTTAALTNLNVIWTVAPISNANQPEQVILYQGGQIFSGGAQFHGRVEFVATMPSTSASIFINNTQLQDTGTYHCMVNNLPDRGGRNIGVIGLTVLVPPSAPVCKTEGSLNSGSDISLMCSSTEGVPRPSYNWKKLDAAPRLPATAFQDHLQGTLILRNISTGFSGLYQCTSSNTIGISTCVVDLKVTAPQAQNVGVIAGVVSGVMVLIICIVLIAIVIYYWRYRHKDEEDEIPNEIREDDLPPKRTSSVKTFRTDASSENNTLVSSNTHTSRYWTDPQASYNTSSFSQLNGEARRSFSKRQAPLAPVQSHHPSGSQPPAKTLLVTANTAPSPRSLSRSSGSVSRNVRPHHTHSYAVSQAVLERTGGARSKAGSLV